MGIAIRGNWYDTSICDLRVRLSFLAFGADSKAKIVAMLASLAASKSCSSLQTFCTSVEQYCATMMPGANIWKWPQTLQAFQAIFQSPSWKFFSFWASSAQADVGNRLSTDRNCFSRANACSWRTVRKQFECSSFVSCCSYIVLMSSKIFCTLLSCDRGLSTLMSGCFCLKFGRVNTVWHFFSLKPLFRFEGSGGNGPMRFFWMTDNRQSSI